MNRQVLSDSGVEYSARELRQIRRAHSAAVAAIVVMGATLVALVVGMLFLIAIAEAFIAQLGD